MRAQVPFEIDTDALMALPEAERQVELARLSALKAQIEANPLWSYVPHLGEYGFKRDHGIPLDGTESRGQVEAHESDAFLTAVIAGNRFGKTHFGVADNLIQVLPPEFIPPWLMPYKKYGLDGEEVYVRSIGVDLPNWLKKALLPKVRKMVPPAALKGGEWRRAWNDKDRQLTFANGSWIDYLTHDMDTDSFASAALHRIHFDEEPPGDRGFAQYEESLARLGDYGGDVRVTMTPLLGLTWLYYEITEDDPDTPGQRRPRNDAEVHVVTGAMEHNPGMPVEHQERLRRRWQKHPLTAAARLRGEWVHFEGKVYEEWEPRHVVADRAIPRAHPKAKPSVPIYGAIDPGIDHPAALIFFWLTEDDVAEVFYAQKWSGYIVADVAREYHAALAALNFTPAWVVIDPSARNRNPVTGRSLQLEFTEHGVHTIPGHNDRVSGIDRVKERLRTDRLKVHASCEELIGEFTNYRWKKPRNTKGEDVGPAGAVIKKGDDLLDALRYGLMSLPQKARHPRDEEPADVGAQRAFRKHLERLTRRAKTPRNRIGSRL